MGMDVEPKNRVTSQGVKLYRCVSIFVFILIAPSPYILAGNANSDDSTKTQVRRLNQMNWNPMFTGTYSDLRYMDETGDLIGEELKIVYTSKGYKGILQVSSGYPLVPFIIDVQIKGNAINYSFVGQEVSKTDFHGFITKEGIDGIERTPGITMNVNMKRTKSYWDKRAAEDRLTGDSNPVGTFTNLEKNRVTGEMKGAELVIYVTGDGYYGAFQYAIPKSFPAFHNELSDIQIVPIQIELKKGDVNFHVDHYYGGGAWFSGKMKKDLLRGMITASDDTEAAIILKRDKSIWDRDE